MPSEDSALQPPSTSETSISPGDVLSQCIRASAKVLCTRRRTEIWCKERAAPDTALDHDEQHQDEYCRSMQYLDNLWALAQAQPALRYGAPQCRALGIRGARCHAIIATLAATAQRGTQCSFHDVIDTHWQGKELCDTRAMHHSRREYVRERHTHEQFPVLPQSQSQQQQHHQVRQEQRAARSGATWG